MVGLFESRLELGIIRSFSISSSEFDRRALFFQESTGVPVGSMIHSVLLLARKSLASNQRNKEPGRSSGIGIRLISVFLPVH